MKALTDKRPWSIVLFTVIFIIAAATVCSVDAKRASRKSGEDLRGIAFDDFWHRVKDEARQWTGDRLYVSQISAIVVDGFDQ
jgi:hypothetical protein